MVELLRNTHNLLGLILVLLMVVLIAAKSKKPADAAKKLKIAGAPEALNVSSHANGTGKSNTSKKSKKTENLKADIPTVTNSAQTGSKLKHKDRAKTGKTLQPNKVGAANESKSKTESSNSKNKTNKDESTVVKNGKVSGGKQAATTGTGNTANTQRDNQEIVVSGKGNKKSVVETVSEGDGKITTNNTAAITEGAGKTGKSGKGSRKSGKLQTEDGNGNTAGGIDAGKIESGKGKAKVQGGKEKVGNAAEKDTGGKVIPQEQQSAGNGKVGQGKAKAAEKKDTAKTGRENTTLIDSHDKGKPNEGKADKTGVQQDDNVDKNGGKGAVTTGDKKSGAAASGRAGRPADENTETTNNGVNSGKQTGTTSGGKEDSTIDKYDDDGYVLIPIEHHSFGGPLANLNHLSKSTLIQLACPIRGSYNITGWRFYADSMLPFYAGIFKVIVADRVREKFMVQLIGANRIEPQATGIQFVRIPQHHRIQTKAGYVIGVFYSSSDSEKKEFKMSAGTVPAEKTVGVPTSGLGPIHLCDVLNFREPKEPYGRGSHMSGGQYYKMALALRIVMEPDCRIRVIRRPYRAMEDMDNVVQGFLEVNFDWRYGGICEDGSRFGSLAEAWGDYACRRANNDDPDFFMAYQYTVSATVETIGHQPTEPILHNPTCTPHPDKLFFESCVNGPLCTRRHTPIIICVRRSQLDAFKAHITSGGTTIP